MRNVSQAIERKREMPRGISKDAEMFERYLHGVTLYGVECLDDIDNEKDAVSVSIVHDSSSYNPLAVMAYAQNNYYRRDRVDECLQKAFEVLENCNAGQQTREESNERYRTIDKEGYDPLTDTFDGQCFVLTVEQFYQVIENCKKDSKSLAKTLAKVVRYEEEEENNE